MHADLHPEVWDLAQLQIPPQVHRLLQAIVPRLQLEHLCIQLLVQLQQQEEYTKGKAATCAGYSRGAGLFVHAQAVTCLQQ